VLFADGSVAFEKTPYCGVGSSGGKSPGDNIYTARAARPTTQSTSLPVSVVGFIGHDVGPVQNDDSYLVPMATDTRPPLTSQPAMAATTATSRPDTSPATTSTAPSSGPATTTTAPIE
jgi:hypothetical protein